MPFSAPLRRASFLLDWFKIESLRKIDNLGELQQALKTKDKVETFSKTTSIPVDYLTVLRREVNSYQPEGRKIMDFPCVSQTIKDTLTRADIKTTIDLYPKIATQKARTEFKTAHDISDEEVLLLAKLTDVSRLRYVNETFATLLVNSPYDTVEKIKQADYGDVYEKLTRINNEKGYFKGKINPKDMKFLVEDPVYPALDIEY